ncbi:hypothetical protein L6452_09248 [Arctium lappa]|uniref:Uncharacterized protein n=1 Tax=Arctium lappa TaxID=4217 RepID=A0ACB9DJT9_ARCLA|nr:hypothetical protein L6452_09248 [Arctium lappa]
MHRKSIARKPRKAWDILSYWCATLNVPDFQMSSEPVSLFREEEHIDFFKSFAKLPAEINLVSLEDLKPDEVLRGYCVLYEYPFKIGFSWPFSPLVRAFSDSFDLTPGQLMPQLWRIVQVIDRLTAEWELPFNVNDLLTAYSVRPDVIDFSVMKPKRDSLNKVQRILDRSIVDRSFSLRSNDEEDEVVLVTEVTPTKGSSKEGENIEEEREGEREEEMTGDATAKSAAARRAEQLELARQGREKSRKRSAPSTGGASPMKGTIAGVELRGSTQVTKDIPLSGVSGVNKPISEVPSSSSKEEKNKEKVGETTFKVTLPSNFMVNDVLERDVIFPHLGKFLLPFRDRYNDSRVEDTGAHAVSLSFMAFQACLSFYAQTEGLRAAFPDVQKRADEALEKEKVALEAVEAEKKKVESLKAKLVEAQSETIKFRDHVLELEALTSKLEKVESLEGDDKDLEEENRQIEAFSRLTARAALMRRHLSGKNPMVSAAEELKTYLDTVGTERDLDEDDELEGSDGGEEAAIAETDVVQEQSDVPPS